MVMTEKLAREWLDKAEALIKEDLMIRGGTGDVEYRYEGSVDQLLQWTTTDKGYATIMNSLNPIYRLNYPVDKRVTFMPETRKATDLLNLLYCIYDHAKLLRIGKNRLLISHDYPSTIVKMDTFKHELMNNLYGTGYSAYVSMTPITPYAHAGNGIISVFASSSVVDYSVRLFGKAEKVRFEEAAAINRHSTEAMLAITLAGYKDKLDYLTALTFHEASAEKHGFRDLSHQLPYELGAK